MQNYIQELDELDINAHLPISQKSLDRLYLCWRNSKNIQCKMIGPQTKCFCNHKFKDHNYLQPKGKMAPCKAAKCPCKCFDYIPSYGSYDFKCLCKHSFKEHHPITRKCQRSNCKNCTIFSSTWTCSCGSLFSHHQTIVQTYLERKSQNKAVGDMQRINMELNSAMQEGSLYKPVKQDPQSRFKQKQINNNPFISKGSIPSSLMIQEEEIEEYTLEKDINHKY